MLLKVPTKEEIAQARHELDIEDAETRGKIELIDELEKYMKKNHCSLEMAYQEIKARYKKTAGNHVIQRKSTGRVR